jgi:hypothetical protein
MNRCDNAAISRFDSHESISRANRSRNAFNAPTRESEPAASATDLGTVGFLAMWTHPAGGYEGEGGLSVGGGG